MTRDRFPSFEMVCLILLAAFALGATIGEVLP